MATRNQIDVSALESLGARRLAELLQATTAHDAVAKNWLRLEIAAAEGPKAAASEIRKRLTAIGRAKKWVPRSQAAILAEDLEFQREAIQGHVAERDASLALELLWRFMALAERVFDRCDDSDGLVGDVFRSGLLDLGRAAAEARPDPVKLADRTFKALWRNGFGQYDGLIGHLASGLSESGLEHLRLKVLAFRDGGAAAAQGEARDNVVAGPWVESRERRDEFDELPVLLEYAIPRALKDIADAQGDVDAFMDQYGERERRIPAFAAEIGIRLLDANRPEEALQVLDDAGAEREDAHPGLYREWRDVRIEVLERLGRGQEAQVARWAIFEQELDQDYLRAHLERLDDSETDEAAERALDHAAGYADVHAALRFLLDWPDLPRAADLVVQRASELHGDFYRLLNAAATSLEAEHPLAATLALRAMIDFTLGSARSTRYRHAARQLLACASLAETIDDYRDFDDHDTYFQEIREHDARKKKFWATLGKAMGLAGPFRP
ncbi:MAG: hypothetical protein OXU63_01640 [Acidobacteriota bacterium]|nr:hypothetical protein [Acidobacteriota bacterium]